MLVCPICPTIAVPRLELPLSLYATINLPMLLGSKDTEVKSLAPLLNLSDAAKLIDVLSSVPTSTSP